MVFFQCEIYLIRSSSAYLDISCLGLVTNGGDLDGEVTFRYVSYHIMACMLGSYAYCSAFEHHDYVWEVFASCFIYYVSVDMRISILCLSRQHHAQCRR